MPNVVVLLFDPNGQADLVPSACTQCTRILVGFSIYAIFLFDERLEAVSVRLCWPSLNFVLFYTKRLHFCFNTKNKLQRCSCLATYVARARARWARLSKALYAGFGSQTHRDGNKDCSLDYIQWRRYTHGLFSTIQWRPSLNACMVFPLCRCGLLNASCTTSHRLIKPYTAASFPFLKVQLSRYTRIRLIV